MPLTQAQESIYHSAVRADKNFSEELRRVYGKKAQDMRYRPNLWTDRKLKASALRFHRATERWLKVMKSFRTANPGSHSIHTAKWDRCVKDVSARDGAKSAAAVCTARIGYEGSVKKGHRRRNPDSRKIPSHSRIWELSNKWIGSRPSTDIYPSSQLVKQLRDAILVEKRAAERGRVKVSSGLLTEMRSELSEVSRYMRQSNPLPSVRKLYYIICAVKGAEKYYLARSGKLTRAQAGAQRFATAQAAIDKAKAHLKNYAASRKYRFDLKLAY